MYLEALVAYKVFGRSSRRFAIGVVIAFVLLLLTFGITNRFSALHQDNPVPSTNSVASIPVPLLVTRHSSLATS